MVGILNFGFTAGKRPSLEKAVWLDLPTAANIPKVGSGEMKDCKKYALGASMYALELIRLAQTDPRPAVRLATATSRKNTQ
jgi:hypothetical protein